MIKKKMRCLIFLVIAIVALISFCHKPLPVPKPVTLLQPPDAMTLRQQIVQLCWCGVSEATGYNIQISKKSNFSSPIVDSVLTDTLLTIELTDAKYFWRVRAQSRDSVWGEWSETWSFRIERYRVVSSIKTYGYAHDVFVDDPYAYIADGQAGLTIVDIEEPSSPTFVANIMDTTHEAWGVVVEEDYAYVAYGSMELWIVDVSDLDSLYVIGSLSYPTPASGYDICVRDSLDYIAAMSQFIIASIADPRYPDLLFQDLFPANVRGVALIDSFALIACEQLGIYIYNIQNPRNANIVAWFDTPGNARDVFCQDSFAFVADGSEGLIVVNIKDKRTPTLVTTLDLPGYARKISIVDNWLYIALGDSGLGVIDITNPKAPKLEAIVKTGYAYSVFATEDYIYVACGRDGLKIIKKEGK
ncbi:MAG: hypothetical protein ABIK67_05105 [candidate division WOR-3 bacterium]